MKEILDIFRAGHHEFENGRFDHIPSDSPFELFEKWIKEAFDAGELESNAFVLSTVDLDGVPSSRIVYFKDVLDHQFVFYTNYSSKKGQDIENNQNVSMLFFWPKSARQILIKGKCTKVTSQISDEYFASRPRGSQIGAWASNQSELLNDRSELEERIEKFEKRFPEEVPRPSDWGGYQIEPFSFEFWQGRPSRLHDRVQFDKHDDEWTVYRKNP